MQKLLTFVISLPEQCPWRAIVLPSALASTNVKVFVKVFKTSLFPYLITNLVHLWYDYTYWSKILHSTIPTTLGHVKVKVTDLEAGLSGCWMHRPTGDQEVAGSTPAEVGNILS